MCRKVELLDKRMMLGVVVTQIVPQMMQFQQLHQHQIEVDSLSSGNLSSIQPAFPLVASTMKKMRSISDMEFSELDLKPYLQDVVAK